MCGICGAIQRDRDDDLPTRVAKMQRALVHRGPDGKGSFSDDGVALAMRRLAIIDVEGGGQPITNGDESVWVMLNGEIYNYRDLRQELIQAGHSLKTSSDTEVLVHLYEESKEDIFLRLRGMFALCIYDRREKSLLLARDPFGEKPLFYSQQGGGLVFSSEVASLLASDRVSRRLDYEALGYYLRAGYVPSPLTMFRDIRQLEPGTWMRWRDGSLKRGVYWTPDYVTSPQYEDESYAQEAVSEAIQRSVSRQLISERPLGAFLSGGIDSSTIVAYCQKVAPEPIRTFTVGFEEAAYDESGIALQVSEALGTNHHEERVANAEFNPDVLWRIIDHVGVPFADSSAIPTYMISKVASQHVTVCLSGDGGDEMFAGYPVFNLGLSLQRLGKLPGPLLKFGEQLSDWAGGVKGLDGSSMVRKGRRAFRLAQTDGLTRMVDMHSFFSQSELSVLAEDSQLREHLGAPPDRLTALPEAAEHWSPLKCLMYYMIRRILPEDMLVKVDRMSMACSLEVRAPFLDVDLAKVAMALPDRHLIRRGENKYILRRLAADRLPQVVLDHPKSGFSVPLHRVQNDAYREMADDLLGANDGPLSLLSVEMVNKTKGLALTRQRDMADASVFRISHQLWALMQLAAWGRRFGVTI